MIDTRAYDNGGRMTSSSYNYGVSESRSYNADNTLASISFSGASIGNLTYSYFSKHRTTTRIRPLRLSARAMSGYGFSVGSSGYDNEDRLVNFNRTNGNLDQSWSLTSVGDWSSVTTEGTAQSRIHGPTHELLTAAGASVSTDVKGNITLIPSAVRPNSQSLLLNWDFDNRLSTADVGNNSSIDVTYKFDALGRRVYRQTSSDTFIYVQSGQQTIADYVSGTAASSPTYRYVYASYIDEPVFRYKPSGSESVYFHRNQQYSIVALTGSSGTILERYAYSAYGVPTIANSSGSVLSASAYANRYTYTGREWDPTLLQYHYRARMYDANLGRFCSRDPIGYTNLPNMYQIGISLMWSDPLGLYVEVPRGSQSKDFPWSDNCDAGEDCFACKESSGDTCAFSALILAGPNKLVSEDLFPEDTIGDETYESLGGFCAGCSTTGKCQCDINRSTGSNDMMLIRTTQGSWLVKPSDFDPQTGDYIGKSKWVSKCLKRAPLFVESEKYVPGKPKGYRYQCHYWSAAKDLGCPEILSITVRTTLEYACLCGKAPDPDDPTQYKSYNIHHTVVFK